MLAWNIIRLVSTIGLLALLYGAGAHQIARANAGAEPWLVVAISVFYIVVSAWLWAFIWDTEQ